MPPLAKWPPFQGDSVAYFGDIREKAPLFEAVWKQNPPKSGTKAIFFVGPEKGFTEQEERRLETLGAQGVRLHAHILRTETAPLAALALMSHWLLTSPN